MKFLLIILSIFTSLIADVSDKFQKLYDKGEYAKAYEVAAKACSKGDPNGCAWSGYLVQNGKETTKDDSKAVYYYTKGSDAGISWAQNALGEMYYRGQGVGINYQKAFELISKACAGNYLTACESIAYLYEKGDGVQQNMNIAYQKYSQTCSAGLSTSCGHAERLKLAKQQQEQQQQLQAQREQLQQEQAYQQEQLRIQREQLRQQKEQADRLYEQNQYNSLRQQNQMQSQQNAQYLQNLQRRMGY